MDTFTIEWNGDSYRAADITIFAGKEDELDVTVADTLFENEILSHMYAGDRLENEAFAMDDKIAYFIEPHEWSLLEEEITRIVEQSYL